MKMIEVLNMMAKGEIKEGTKLTIDYNLDSYEYEYSNRGGYRAFYNNFDKISKMRIDDDFPLDEDFLNLEVKLIPPKEQKYLIKLPNTKIYVGLGYDRDGTNGIYTYTKKFNK